jgi:uncharacterized membrane protein
METHYNRFAARDVGRISALSDGIFAVAMTLIAIEIRTPASADVHSEGELWAALVALSPHLLTWLLSLLTLGIFWVGQQTQINQIARADRNFSWLHFVFLAVITAMPFSARLLAEFFSFRIALLVYWANIALAGASLYACWIYAERTGLLSEGATAPISSAIKRRIVIAQALYAVGALVGLISVPAGVVLIIAIQLNYAIAPRLPILFRL